MSVQSPPEGSQTLTAYLVLDDCAGAIDFYKRVLGAEEMFRMDAPDGKIGYAALRFGDSQIMVSDVFEQAPYEAPRGRASTAGMYLYVDDVDTVRKRALDAGATENAPVADMFWGDRWCQVTDPYGHVWELATHVEDVSPEQLGERARQAMAGAA